MDRERATKIVATLGPATTDESAIAALVEAGADVFRLNFSHGTHAEHAARLAVVRGLETRFGRPLGVLADLQGPKLRVGTFAGGRTVLEAGRSFRLDLDPTPGDEWRASLPHPEIFAALKAGARLLLDDGRLELRVERVAADNADTEVVAGGPLSDRKGVNVPDVVLDISALTAKDRTDLAFALDLGVDWIALSFVQRPEDVAEAQRLIDGRAWLMAKLEKPSAIRHLYPIVARADGIMVARGDLGVEMDPAEVPPIQRQVIRAARAAGRPVVVATQMLESMIHNPTPTRAEASDVANAVYEGADAVMLSGETAVGAHAAAAVGMMDRIIGHVERDVVYRSILDSTVAVPETTPSDALTLAACQVAETVDAAAIVTFTAGGTTTLRTARDRPKVPILALTPDRRIAGRLALVWDVHPRVVSAYGDVETMRQDAAQLAADLGFASDGCRVVILAGVPLMVAGATNMLFLSDLPPARLRP
jgi:pyruvate kinase